MVMKTESSGGCNGDVLLWSCGCGGGFMVQWRWRCTVQWWERIALVGVTMVCGSGIVGTFVVLQVRWWNGGWTRMRYVCVVLCELCMCWWLRLCTVVLTDLSRCHRGGSGSGGV